MRHSPKWWNGKNHLPHLPSEKERDTPPNKIKKTSCAVPFLLSPALSLAISHSTASKRWSQQMTDMIFNRWISGAEHRPYELQSRYLWCTFFFPKCVSSFFYESFCLDFFFLISHRAVLVELWACFLLLWRNMPRGREMKIATSAPRVSSSFPIKTLTRPLNF